MGTPSTWLDSPLVLSGATRCYRLKRECRAPKSIRHRGRKKPTITKTARLEEKLDGLVSLIKAGTPASAIAESPRIPPSLDNPTRYGTVDHTSSSYEPSPIEAEECLTHFRTYKSRYFPFVHIPSTTSAKQLQQERPFLWLCIMTVSSKSASQQQVLDRKLRQTIAQEMIFLSTQNVDLLLGLLAFLGWYGESRSPSN
jgi:hypothetical protein